MLKVSASQPSSLLVDGSVNFLRVDHDEIIEQDFGKNKVNSFKGTVYYKFWSDKAFYKEISRQEALDIEKANAESRSGVSDDDDGPLNTFGENEVPDYGNNKFTQTI